MRAAGPLRLPVCDPWCDNMGTMRDRPRYGFVLASLAPCALSACAHGVALQPEAERPSPTAAVEVRFERSHHRIEADGSRTFTYEVEYEVHDPAAVASWSTLDVAWAPWRQATPELSASVVTAAGERLALDPATIVTAEIDEAGSDRRLRAQADLPGVGPGAVVTQRLVFRDDPSPVGVEGRHDFGLRVPVERSELVIELPEDVPVAVEVRGARFSPEVVERGGVRTVTYALDRLLPRRLSDKHLPADVPRGPYVAFSTAPSWSAVVAPFADEVERSLRGAEVGSLLEGVPSDALAESVADAAMRRVREKVRASGRKFGQGARVPMHPEETLTRGEGDDEDIAQILVAALRSRGFDARLALVRSGPGEDLLPGLPGLAGFDRALVKVEGPAPLWIDPMDPYTRPGDLPPAVQGRWALVVAETTRALEATPVAAAVDNLYVEERHYEFASYGLGRVVETTRAFGAIGARLRAQLDREEDRRENVAGYVASHYGRARLGESRFSDPRALDQPVEVVLEALDAQVLRTELTSARLELRGAVLFGWLPPLLRDAALAPPGEPENEPEQLRAMAAALIDGRREPLHLDEPYVAELRVEIEPPLGFEFVELPSDFGLDLGPARLEGRYGLERGRLVGRLRFDTGPGRYEPEAARGLVAGLREVFRRPILQLRLEHQGARLIGAGQVREGIRAYARLAAAEPDEAHHRARLALALLELGLGDGARAMAAEAVELDPNSPLTRFVQGRILAHDRLGRLHAPGFDREGAMEALRLVKALEPGNVAARAELAALRSLDERGLSYGDPVRVEAAVAEYRSLRADTGVQDFDEELLEALFRGERFEDVLFEAETTRRSLPRDAHVLAAAVALTGQVEAADEVLGALSVPDAAVPLLETAAATALAAIARYDEARALLSRTRASGRELGPLAERAERIESMRTFAEVRRPPEDPVRVVQDLLSAAILGEPLDRFFSSSLDVEARRRATLPVERLFGGMARAGELAKVPVRVLRDGVLSSTELRADGDPQVGFRVRALVEGRRPTWWFVLPEEGGYRVAATERSLWTLGELSLAALADGRPAAADRWLGWAEALVEDGRRPDRFDRPAFSRVRRDRPQDIEGAAVALAASSGTSEALGRAARRPERDLFSHARIEGLLGQDRWAEALPLIAGLAAKHPDSDALYRLHVAALTQLERWGPALRVVKARLKARPEDREALEQLANLATARGRFAEGEAILERLAGGPAAGSMVLNNLAWLALFRPTVDERDLGRALEANRLSRGQSPAELHTLAALHAERGDTEATLKLVRRRLELRAAPEPESADHYLLGRVMEHLGLWRLAREAYGRVENDEGNRADSTHALTQRRLKALAGRSSI